MLHPVQVPEAAPWAPQIWSAVSERKKIPLSAELKLFEDLMVKRILEARTAGKLSNSQALSLLKELWAGETQKVVRRLHKEENKQ